MLQTRSNPQFRWSVLENQNSLEANIQRKGNISPFGEHVILSDLNLALQSLKCISDGEIVAKSTQCAHGFIRKLRCGREMR